MMGKTTTHRRWKVSELAPRACFTTVQPQGAWRFSRKKRQIMFEKHITFQCHRDGEKKKKSETKKGVWMLNESIYHFKCGASQLKVVIFRPLFSVTFFATLARLAIGRQPADRLCVIKIFAAHEIANDVCGSGCRVWQMATSEWFHNWRLGGYKNRHLHLKMKSSFRFLIKWWHKNGPRVMWRHENRTKTGRRLWPWPRPYGSTSICALCATSSQCAHKKWRIDIRCANAILMVAWKGTTDNATLEDFKTNRSAFQTLL